MSEELEGHPVRLPSGLVARLQRPDPDWLGARQEEIELVKKLAPIALDIVDKPEGAQALNFLGELAREIFVGPKLDDGSYPTLDLADIVYIFAWFAGETPLDGCPAQRVM